ncbi:hypothetical protein P4H32_26370, partial [Bacillus cereus]|nr:hypothetical protein [Bacillus cereus]
GIIFSSCRGKSHSAKYDRFRFADYGVTNRAAASEPGIAYWPKSTSGDSITPSVWKCSTIHSRSRGRI